MLPRNRNFESAYSAGICGWKRSNTFKSVKVGFRFVQVVEILSAPAKSFSFGMLDASDIDLSFFENIFVLGGEVIAHHGDDSDLREIAGGQRKICTANRPVRFPRAPKA